MSLVPSVTLFFFLISWIFQDFFIFSFLNPYVSPHTFKTLAPPGWTCLSHYVISQRKYSSGGRHNTQQNLFLQQLLIITLRKDGVTPYPASWATIIHSQRQWAHIHVYARHTNIFFSYSFSLFSFPSGSLLSPWMLDPVSARFRDVVS